MTDTQNDDSFKTGGALDMFVEAAQHRGDTLIGRKQGDYRNTRPIADGGMSRIFAAERIDVVSNVMLRLRCPSVAFWTSACGIDSLSSREYLLR